MDGGSDLCLMYRQTTMCGKKDYLLSCYHQSCVPEGYIKCIQLKVGPAHQAADPWLRHIDSAQHYHLHSSSEHHSAAPDGYIDWEIDCQRTNCTPQGLISSQEAASSSSSSKFSSPSRATKLSSTTTPPTSVAGDP